MSAETSAPVPQPPPATRSPSQTRVKLVLRPGDGSNDHHPRDDGQGRHRTITLGCTERYVGAISPPKVLRFPSWRVLLCEISQRPQDDYHHAIDDELRREFLKGFYKTREARWLERLVTERDDVVADVAGCLAALDAGRRNFAYPRHDEQVYEILRRLVSKYDLRTGADIGCATGCFPAMQLRAGVDRCTVFEVRPTDANDERVDVRVQDLTYADDVDAEFDLVTCLSTIEHIGLGRYGDKLDPWGDVKMAANLRRLVRPGGILMLSFPIGRGTVMYNAHRIYTSHRRALLFGEMELIHQASGRSRLGQLRHKMEVCLGLPGASSQPIYVLQR